MTIYQQQSGISLSYETLLSAGNSTANGSSNQLHQDLRLNFQIHQKDVEQQAMTNDLTGSTLNVPENHSINSCVVGSEAPREADELPLTMDLLDEFLNLGAQQHTTPQQSKPPATQPRSYKHASLTHPVAQSTPSGQFHAHFQRQFQEQFQQHAAVPPNQRNCHYSYQQPQTSQRRLRNYSFAPPGRRLSITGYHSDKPIYYEYEFFGKQNAEEEEEEATANEDDILTTDDEDLYNLSHLMTSPGGKARKDSIFSDYGNEMVMPLPQAQQINMQVEDYTPMVGMESMPQWRKMKDIFKWNLFGGGKVDSQPPPAEYVEMNEDEQEHHQPFKKKYFWSRKPNTPVIQTDSQEEASVNPSELVRSSSFDLPLTLDCITPSSTDVTSSFTASTSVTGNELPEPFSHQLKMEQGSIYFKEPLLKMAEHMPSFSSAPDPLDPGVTKKRAGMPKTRGRKPSPALDATKPFGCEYCERRFKRQEHLKRHIRSLHMGEKPYGCDICGKKFSRSDNLNQHIKTHSNGATERKL
ncbi:AaceriACL057Wp [[Ashbya] aceris (nom. inval.)]|nr:AaceriACL057Wp [[Ashbya] aceris (nom. inval.)]